MRLIDEEDDVVTFLHFIEDAFDSFLEHTAEHRACDESAHLKLHDVRVTQTRRNFLRFEFDESRESFDDSGLSDSRFPDQHRGVRAFLVAENFDHLLDFLLASYCRRNLVLTRQAVE